MYIRLILYCLLLSQITYAKKIDNLATTYCQRWNWMSICDFAYANNSDAGVGAQEFKNDTPFNPADVFPGAIIFATGHSINHFFATINPLIKHPYILVTMYGGVLEKYLDDPKVIAWFANDAGSIQNHQKFTMIPIGVSRHEGLFYHQAKVSQFFSTLRQKPKNKLIYMNFTVHHWSPERRAIYDMFYPKSFVTTSPAKPFDMYMEEMADFKFALSPQGDMWDCYRHWEAMMVGTIPIVIRSCISPLFDGLPVLIVDDWSEINESFLNKKYKEIKNKRYNLRKLYLQYWFDKIDAIKKTYRS